MKAALISLHKTEQSTDCAFRTLAPVKDQPAAPSPASQPPHRDYIADVVDMAERPHNLTSLPYDVTSAERQQNRTTSRTSPPPASSIPAALAGQPEHPQPEATDPHTASSSSRRARTFRSDSSGLSAGRAQGTAMDLDAGLVDADGIPITYTPTTRRISKAKKGKKVHVCEFGCGKVCLYSSAANIKGCKLTRIQVFTRAEHRKCARNPLDQIHCRERLLTCD